MTGFILLHRRIRNHPVVGIRNPLGFTVFCALVMDAAHAERKVSNGGNVVTLLRGQTIASRSYLAEQTGASEQQIRTILSKLELHGMIEKSTSNGQGAAAVVTICNYETYQARELGQQPANQPAINQQSTSNQPHLNKETTKQEEKAPLTPKGEPGTGQPELPLAGCSDSKAKTHRSGSNSAPIAYTAQFEAAWSAYPKDGRKEKASAFKAWSALSEADKAALPGWVERLKAELAADRARGFNRRPKDMHRWLAKCADDYRAAPAIQQQAPAAGASPLASAWAEAQAEERARQRARLDGPGGRDAFH